MSHAGANTSGIDYVLLQGCPVVGNTYKLRTVVVFNISIYVSNQVFTYLTGSILNNLKF